MKFSPALPLATVVMDSNCVTVLNPESVSWTVKLAVPVTGGSVSVISVAASVAV